MIINISDIEILSELTEQIQSVGYHYAVVPVDQISDSATLEFFKTAWEAKECCFEKSNDMDYFKYLPINSIIRDLNMLRESGIDTSDNEAFDLTAFGRLEREKRELLENNLNINVMNQKNLEYLKDQLKYTGFGETFDQDLKEKMLKGEKEFKLMKEGVYGTDSMSAVLNFKKSDQSDLYFFNSYHVNLKKEGSKESLEQTFYVNNNSSSITLKEAYNLMEGRSINKDLKTKEGEVYTAWIKMDFKEVDDSNGNFKLNYYHQNYGYDLEASLAKHSIKELETPKYKDDLLNSLKKGNLQSVTFVVAGVDSKMYVEANPQFKTVNVYDVNKQRINHRESKDEKQGVAKEKDKNQKQGNDDELSQSEKNSNNRKTKVSKSI